MRTVPHRRRSRTSHGAVLLIAAVALSGCVSMPTSGPITETDLSSQDSQQPGISIDPLPPQPGATRSGIVEGFLDAMLATPVQTSTASQFLTETAREQWDPSQETITYTERTSAGGSGPIRVELRNAMHVDARGTWQGALPAERGELEFQMAKVGGQWRIASAPNALIVPQTWFTSRFTQVALFFFDPTARLLVPEPVFVPRGSQLATALVRGLVRGASDDGVTRSFIPGGATEGLSVPIAAGIADIQLSGADQMTPESPELMVAQLAYTLRQVDGLTGFRVFLGGQQLNIAGRNEWSVYEGSAYDAAQFPQDGRLFGLSRGRVVAGSADEMTPVPGPAGARPGQWRSFAVSGVTSRIAAVSDDGHTLSVSAQQRGAGARTLIDDGSDLMAPQWDRANRLWVVDRTAEGADVTWLRGSRSHPIQVPGISGQDVRQLLVSSDGTRLVALVHRNGGDMVMISRLIGDEDGRTVRATRATAITDGDSLSRIRDIAWSTGTSVLVLHQLADTALVRTASVDGAQTGFPAITTTIAGRAKDLASAIWSVPIWALTPTQIVGLTPEGEDRSLPVPLSRLQYSN